MHKVCRLVILSGRAAAKRSGGGAAGEDRLRSQESTVRRCGGPMAGLRLRCRGGDFAEECHHALNQDKSEIPEPVDDTTGLVDAEHRPGGPGTSAGLPLLETADTQQAALRDGDRAGERGQVVTGDHLRERSGHGPRRLVRRAQYQDAGMATRRVRPDVASPRSRVINNRSSAAAAATTCGSGAPPRSSSTTVSTSCPAAMRTWRAERGMFSSSLTLTRGPAGPVPHGPAAPRTRRPPARLPRSGSDTPQRSLRGSSRRQGSRAPR